MTIRNFTERESTLAHQLQFINKTQLSVTERKTGSARISLVDNQLASSNSNPIDTIIVTNNY